ncbi:MAG: PLP-dependent transferase, partial [Gammaproteobacteria bacterium]|nr:PLP-dependent transferase [Gammaproteobacteria bacterium]
MAKPPNFKFDTLSLHAGQRPDPTTGSRATPIYQSASFVFKDTDYAVGLFNI